MTAVVKQGPSTYRREQAVATKERIAVAAQRLFSTRGYASTSMDAIAREAGVAARTVYVAFGAKREILSAICAGWLERARARPLAAEILARPDPVDRIRGAAHWLTVLYSTDFDVVLILDAAADEDPETRDVLRSKLRGRNRTMDALIASVEEQLTIPLADAQAIYRAYASAGVYRELVIGNGWPIERFETWLADVLIAQLTVRSRQE